MNLSYVSFDNIIVVRKDERKHKANGPAGFTGNLDNIITTQVEHTHDDI